MAELPTGPRIPNNPTLEVITTSLASCALSKTNKTALWTILELDVYQHHKTILWTIVLGRLFWFVFHMYTDNICTTKI